MLTLFRTTNFYNFTGNENTCQGLNGFPKDGGMNIIEFGKSIINFAKRFAIFVYTCYTVWAL